MEWHFLFQGGYQSSDRQWRLEKRKDGVHLHRLIYPEGRPVWSRQGVFGSPREAKEYARRASDA